MAKPKKDGGEERKCPQCGEKAIYLKKESKKNLCVRCGTEAVLGSDGKWHVPFVYDKKAHAKQLAKVAEAHDTWKKRKSYFDAEVALLVDKLTKLFPGAELHLAESLTSAERKLRHDEHVKHKR